MLTLILVSGTIFVSTLNDDADLGAVVMLTLKLVVVGGH
jgi:hypothetical protein